MLNIGGLSEGVVIDHIVAGGAMRIYEYLNLEKLDCSVAIIKNAKSNKMGKKDIIKIEGPIKVDLDMLGVLDPNLTLDIIRDGHIIEKRNQGCAILLLSADLDELFRLSDRLVTLYDGRITAEFEAGTID